MPNYPFCYIILSTINNIIKKHILNCEEGIGVEPTTHFIEPQFSGLLDIPNVEPSKIFQIYPVS